MASSFSSNMIPPKKYDVFLSFRGEDTRYNFTSHLHASLCRKHIETFIDYQLPRGDEISQSLLDAIEESYISVIIFSERYASSGWCLDELVKILECKNNYEQVVIPVFYRVDPSDVRNQTGIFGDSFSKLEQRFQGRLDKLQKWRIALREVANVSGFDSHVIRPESELIENIANEILERMKHLFSNDNNDQLIGVESRILEIESLLNNGTKDVYKMGIWGIGGIGKTTIATAVFNKISSYFDGSYFIQNVRESEKNGGLAQLQEKLFSTLLKDENVKTDKLNMGFNFRRLSRMKVLILLDDVTGNQQIESLVGSLDRFGTGSRIIITTRDKHVLEVCGVHDDGIYKMNELVHDDALKLFSRHAFRKNDPDAGYEELSSKVIEYAQGVPLALKVLGCFLYKRSEEEWVSEINKLKDIPHMDIQKVLKVSYDGLDRTEKNIFLDIACFFKGRNKDAVAKFLGACGFYPEIGIRVLIDRCLISISYHNEIAMHDLLQEMGREIIRQESINNPGRRSRLWHHEDIYKVFTLNTVTEAIEGISLDMSQMKNSICLQPGTFAKMYNLRFIEFGSSIFGNDINKVHIQDMESSMMELRYLHLRYLHWVGYPLKSLLIHPEKLVSLKLSNSKVEQLWDGVQDLVNLKVIDLSCSEQLTKLPDLSNAQNLEYLFLSSCSSLVETHSSIEHLSKLVILNLQYCPRLESLPSSLFNLESLRLLNLFGCSNLKRLPEILSYNLEVLHLQESAIEELPRSIEYLSRLVTLNLSDCSRLERLPSNLFNLDSLRKIDLSGCSNLKRLPEISSCNLEELYLQGSAIEERPQSIEGLSRLVTLNLSDYSRLESLPSSLCNLKSLQNLYISNCGIRELPESLDQLYSLKKLYLDKNNFGRIPESIINLSKLEMIDLSYCERLQSLPNLPCSLTYMHANHCSSLEALSGLSILFKIQKSYQTFELSNCLKLDENELKKIVDNALQKIQFAVKQYQVHGSHKICYPGNEISRWFTYNMCYPGSEIPEWFKYQSMGSSITLERPPCDHRFSNEFVVFAFCVIVAFEHHHQRDQRFGANCKLKVKTEDAESNLVDDFWIGEIDYVEVDHVILGCNDCVKLINTKWVSLEFEFELGLLTELRFWKSYEVVKKCGIRLLSTHDYEESKEDRCRSFSCDEGEEPQAKRLNYTTSSF